MPDLSAGSALRMSSVILSNQREPVKAQIAGAQNNKKLLAQNPLIDAGGSKTVPNVTRVFRTGQNLFVYFEVYDPVVPDGVPANLRVAEVSAEIGLYQGDRKVLESPPARATRLSPRGEGVLPVRIDTALGSLKPGQYTCQVSVIDRVGRKFAFPRTPIAVLPPAMASAQPTTERP